MLSSRKQARLQDDQYYFTGRSCNRGHLEKRYSSDGSCIRCSIERADERYKNKKVEVLTKSKERYQKNSQLIRDRVNIRRCLNVDKVKDEKKREYEKNKVKYIKRASEWSKCNVEKVRLIANNFYKKNRLKCYMSVVRRRAMKLQRTPNWLLDSDKKEIENIYLKSFEISKKTNIKHHVDHIIPLGGKFVSGLHVPWNLQILTACENMSKGNR